MSTLNELLERVRGATGPDRELDAGIARVCGYGLVQGEWHHGSLEYYAWEAPVRAGPWIVLPEYTASIDTALALVKRALPPDANLALKQHANGKYFHAEIETDEDDFTAYNHPSLPLAILAALLSALIAQEPK